MHHFYILGGGNHAFCIKDIVADFVNIALSFFEEIRLGRDLHRACAYGLNMFKHIAKSHNILVHTKLPLGMALH